MSRIDQRTGFDNFRADADIFARTANIEPRLGGFFDCDISLPRGRPLFHYDGSNTLRNGGAGQEPHHLSRCEPRRSKRSGNNLAGQLERTGGCCGDIAGMDSVPVHRALVEWRQWYLGNNGDYRDATRARAQRDRLFPRHGRDHPARDLQCSVDAEQSGPVTDALGEKH